MGPNQGAIQEAKTSDVMANKEFISDWYSPKETKKLQEKIEVGDLLEVYCSNLYCHWGVFVGKIAEGENVLELIVVHFNRPLNSEGGLKPLGSLDIDAYGIVMHELDKFILERHVRINNSLDLQVKPIAQTEIVQKALYSVTLARVIDKTTEIKKEEKKEMYNLFFNNCEHFAHRMRNSASRSTQVENAAKYVGVATVLSAAVGIPYGRNYLTTRPEQTWGQWFNLTTRPEPTWGQWFNGETPQSNWERLTWQTPKKGRFW